MRILTVALLLLVATTTPGQNPDLFDESLVRTIEITFQQNDWQARLAANYASKTYLAADLKVDGKIYSNVGVRYRGNSSYKSVPSLKKPFKISMDEFVPGTNLFGHNTLNLNNGFRDPTFLREVLSLQVFRRVSPASRANWVLLRINGQDFGLYVNVQQINKDMLKAWFRDPSGLRYRGERGLGGTADDPALRWLGANAALYTRGYELKTETAPNPWVNLVQTCNVASNTPAASLHAELPKILDVDQCIRYLACNNVLPAMDSYIGNVAHNFHVYEDPWHQRTALLPWDLNASFGGNNWLTVAQKQQLDPFYFTDKTNRPLLARVLVDSEWRERYLAHVRTILADSYRWDWLGPLVTRYQSMLDAHVMADPVKLYSYADFKANVTTDVSIVVSGRPQWIPGLKPLVDTRRAYLLARADVGAPAPSLDGLRQEPAEPGDRDVVWVTAAVRSSVGLAWVKLYWRTVGRYQEALMYDDGQHRDGAANDGVFGASIPAQTIGSAVEYYLGARSDLTRGGAMAFLPATAGHLPPGYRVERVSTPGPLRINELLADNKSTDRDEHGDFDDWAELHNTGTTPITITGYFLSDNLATPRAWAFPANTVIPAGGFLRVWLDDEPAEGPLHATFKLDKAGEELVLSDPNGKVLDLMVFGPQATDRSFGCVPDGGPFRFYLWRPSGGAPLTGPGTGSPLPFDRRRDGSNSGFGMVSFSDPAVGKSLELRLHGGPPTAAAFLGLSLGLRPIDLGPAGPVLIDAASGVILPLLLDAQGGSSLRATIPPNARGLTLFAQAAAVELGNALAIRFY